jgi:hypothetical protein
LFGEKETFSGKKKKIQDMNNQPMYQEIGHQKAAFDTFEIRYATIRIQAMASLEQIS